MKCNSIHVLITCSVLLIFRTSNALSLLGGGKSNSGGSGGSSGSGGSGGSGGQGLLSGASEGLGGVGRGLSGVSQGVESTLNGENSPSKKSQSPSKSKSASKKDDGGEEPGASGLLGGVSQSVQGVSKGLAGYGQSFNFLLGGGAMSQDHDGFSVEQGDVAILDGDLLSQLDVNLWRNGIIYYQFHESVSKEMKDVFNLAMKEWEDYTCLRFQEKQTLDTLFFMKYRTDNMGCYSFIGRTYKDAIKGQDVNIGEGCEDLHTTVHEIGHALGLAHEQARNDRDDYITINYGNIQTGMQSQFSKQNSRNEYAEYDYKSVMHYPSWGFSTSPFEKITMSTLNPTYQYLIDEQRQGLTFKDIKVMNIIYECQQKCPKEDLEEECENGGYKVPYKSIKIERCICMCPNGFYGNFCEKRVLKSRDEDYGLEYYGGPRCKDQNVTSEQTLRTPGYPRRIKTQPGCSWWIQAPKGFLIQVDFKGFSFRRTNSIGAVEDKCIFEKVELRTRDIHDPDLYCDDMLQGMSVTSEINDFVIVIVPDIRPDKDLEGSGMEARVRFIEEDDPQESDDGVLGSEGILGRKRRKRNIISVK